MQKLLTQLYARLISPKSDHPDNQRRELIFNVLVALFALAALVALISSGLNHLLGNAPSGVNSLPITAAFLMLTSGLWRLSRKGHYRIGAYTLVGLVWLASLQLVLAWSFELPMAQLINVLVIALAGVLLSSLAASIFTLLVVITTLVIGSLQVQGILVANTRWMSGSPEFSDAIGQAVVFVIIGGILWLSNREIDSLLRRAWNSEAELAKERDQLEVTVAKRTQELEQTQLARILELQQFAEFGRVSASLLHDLANPLTAAALNLEEAGGRRRSKLVDQAMVSIGHIERYITAARKQLQGSDQKSTFTVGREISEVVELLANKSTKLNVTMKLQAHQHIQLYGNQAAFSRVMANLLVNAIHAYEGKASGNKTIHIAVARAEDIVTISIQDHGVGIKSADLPHIFEDFYSTKKQVGRGLGLGLASAKQAIEHDFKGKITAVSTQNSGTIFTIEIPINEPSNTRKHTGRSRVSGKKTRTKRRV